MNAGDPPIPPTEGVPLETTGQLQHPPMVQPHGFIQCPVSYLPPEEWEAVMERLDALLPLVEELPETIEGASDQVLMVGDRMEQEMSRRMTVWKEEIYLATTQSTNTIRQQIDQLERMHRENATLLKNLTSKLYPMAGIAAGFGATIMALIWMILS